MPPSSSSQHFGGQGGAAAGSGARGLRPGVNSQNVRAIQFYFVMQRQGVARVPTSIKPKVTFGL
jgi:hypothetical protein